MSKDYEAFRKTLLALRARLTGDVQQIEHSTLRQNRSETELSSMPSHMADVSSDNSRCDSMLRLMENSSGILGKVNAALERIDEGTYGTCEVCGAKIPKGRLQAIPYASMCVKCAEKAE